MEENQSLNEPRTPSSPAEQTTPSVKSSDGAKKGKKKIMIGLAIMIVTFTAFILLNVIISSLGLGYAGPLKIPTMAIVSPTPDPTANWKTYTNDKLGITLKYPVSYQLIKEDSNSFSFGFKDTVGNGPIEYLTVTNNPTVSYQQLNICTNSSKNPELVADKLPCLTSVVANTTLNGVPAKSIHFTEGVDRDFHIIETLNAPTIQVKMNVSGGGLERDFEQILSTFKFTNQTIDTSNWKIYSDQQASFMYPDGWFDRKIWGEGAMDVSGFEKNFSNYQFINPDGYGDISTVGDDKSDHVLFSYGIVTATDYNNKTIQDYWNENKVPNVVPQTVDENGIEFIIYDDTNKINGDHPTTNYTRKAMTMSNGSRYDLDLTVNSKETFDETLPVFDKIVSSFKITPVTPTP